jgi:hypothetical protein
MSLCMIGATVYVYQSIERSDAISFVWSENMDNMMDEWERRKEREKEKQLNERRKFSRNYNERSVRVSSKFNVILWEWFSFNKMLIKSDTQHLDFLI